MRAMDLFYRALNVPMTALLRSPLHGLASRNLCLLTYRGRKTGRRITTPLSYVRETDPRGRDLVRLLSSRRTRWWRNFVGAPAEVEVEIAGEVHAGRAEALLEDGDRFRDGIRRFLTALPRDAVVYGIGLDRDRRPKESDLAAAAGHVVLAEVLLEGGAAA